MKGCEGMLELKGKRTTAKVTHKIETNGVRH